MLDLRGVFDLEYTALKMLTEAEKSAARARRELWLVGLNPDVLGVVQRSPLGEAWARADALQPGAGSGQVPISRQRSRYALSSPALTI